MNVEFCSLSGKRIKSNSL